MIIDLKLCIHGMLVADCTEVDELAKLVEKNINSSYEVTVEILSWDVCENEG